MPTINQLSAVTSVVASDLLPLYSSANGDARKASMSVVLDFIEANFGSPEFTTIINAPTSPGFNILMAAATSNLWLIINPTGPFVAGTITLPPVASCYDGQQIIVTCSQSITTLTLAGNGATIVGAPTALGTGGFFALRFNDLQSAWYCVSQSLGATTNFTNITITNAILDANGNEILALTPASSSAVNHVLVSNTATGNSPGLLPEGTDASIGFTIETKGNGDIFLQPAGTGVARVDGFEILTESVSATGTSLRVLSNNPEIIFAELTAPILMTGTFANIDATRAIYAAFNNATGMMALCTDAATTRALGIAGNTTVVGGGANNVPIWYDGTNWKY